ncbi:MAG: RidA family protein [Methyloligellaceae bacterium]
MLRAARWKESCCRISGTTGGCAVPPKVETSTPVGVMEPIGPYSHVAKAGQFITIGAVAGVDPATGELAGPDVSAQTLQILDAFEILLDAVGSDLNHVLHINIHLTNMDDFRAMNDVYAEKMGDRRPARTSMAVANLPKAGALITMNLTAVTREQSE